MDSWVAYVIVAIVFIIFIGNLSIFQKNIHHKMRNKSLNDLKETLPRSQQTEHKMPTIDKKKR
ncbi:MAG: hypothetical protein JKY81_04010 [Colwellia sp.]|nr:hypothetical protein [Colwellia sp.]